MSTGTRIESTVAHGRSVVAAGIGAGGARKSAMATSNKRRSRAMTTHNPDVLQPTRGSKSREERQRDITRTNRFLPELFAFYGVRSILKKEVVDAVTTEIGCSPETAQGYVDDLTSRHPRSRYVVHEVNHKPHVSPKDPQLLAEDAAKWASRQDPQLLTENAGELASQQDSEQPPKPRRSRQRQGGDHG